MEISVVILLIGLLIAGISKGTDMIGDFRIQTARNLTKSAPMVRMEGMTLWLETTSAESFDENIDISDSTKNKVALWKDINPQSKTRMDFTQSTDVQKPALIKDPVMNGLPVILFDGTNDYLLRDNVLGSDFAQSDQITAFVALKFPVTQNTTILVWQPSPDGNNRFNIHPQWGDGRTYFDFGDVSDGSGRLASNVSEATPYVNKAAILTVIRKPTNGNIRVNGYKFFGTNSSLTKIFDITQSTTFYIGGSPYFGGAVGEIIIFNRGLKDGEVTSIEKYLAQKWGVKLVSR